MVDSANGIGIRGRARSHTCAREIGRTGGHVRGVLTIAAVEPCLLVTVERRLLRGMHLLPGCKLLLLLGDIHLRTLALLKHHPLLLSACLARKLRVEPQGRCH